MPGERAVELRRFLVTPEMTAFAGGLLSSQEAWLVRLAMATRANGTLDGWWLRTGHEFAGGVLPPLSDKEAAAAGDARSGHGAGGSAQASSGSGGDNTGGGGGGAGAVGRLDQDTADALN